MTLKMTTAQVVETSVTVTNSSFKNYTHPDDHTRQTTDTPEFKPFTMLLLLAQSIKAYLRSGPPPFSSQVSNAHKNRYSARNSSRTPLFCSNSHGELKQDPPPQSIAQMHRLFMMSMPYKCELCSVPQKNFRPFEPEI